ncbi:MAG: ATP-dependent sacrificial sulfur transferase LarE [Ruminiclostridium sp.]|nr:ATP-dependent sacrificial sulfur transferase LarE [Ruminiclostridium sp.]
MDNKHKLAKLKENLKRMEKLAVAYSGGVDSTFLLKVAHDTLKDNVIAVTARSSTYPEREYNEAVAFVKTLGAKHITIVSEELDIEGFSGNPVNRCYFCKKELFTKISRVAGQYGITYLADGSNTDDLGDYRPGMAAMKELKVVSPLREADMSKDDIRALSREMGLPTWDKQPFACLASRFPYGQEITREKLGMIDKAEQYMLDMGFRQVRVRMHGDVARIEVAVNERRKFFDEAVMDKVHNEMREIGFKYVTLDLKGYRTGSMNEVINTGT